MTGRDWPRPLLLLACLFLACLLASSKTSWARETGRVGTTTYNKHYLHPPQIFERMSLPSFGISDCLQDSTGFIWVATESQGLVRWDGYDERAYKNAPDAPVTIPSSFITDLVAHGDDIWVGTGDAGLLRLHVPSDSITHLPADPDNLKALSNSGVLVVFMSSRNTLWVATSDGVLHRYDPVTNSFVQIDTFAELETEIRVIVEDPAGKLWIGTSSEGLYLFDPDTRQVRDHHSSDDENSLGSDEILSLLVDEDGTLWVGTNAGLYRRNKDSDSFRAYRQRRNDRTSLADDNVRVLFRDREGTLWVGTENGMHAMDKAGDSFLQYVRDPEAPATTADFPRLISCAMQDQGGVLYFADPTSAMYRVNPTRYKLSPYYYASQLTELIDVVEGSKPGVMWGTTFAQGLARYDFNRRQISIFPVLGDEDSAGSVKLNQWLLAIHLDRKGRLWAGGQSSGLIFFDPKNGDYKQYLHQEDQIEGLTSNDIQDIKEGIDGSIWVATFGGGLNRFFPDSNAFMEFISEADDPVSLSSNYLLALQFDRKNPNALWIGTARGGLNRLNIKSERFARYSLAPPDGDVREYDSVFAIYQQEDGVLWLGTDGGGLVSFDLDNDKRQYYSRNEGIAHPSIYGILPGPDGELWLSTNGGGLIRFEPHGPKAETFTKADGLAYDVFNQHGYMKSSDGKLVFTAGNGFLRFDPRELTVDSFKPPAVLTSFKIFDKEVALDTPIWSNPSITLDYTDSVISFEFAGLSFAAPEQNRYMYKMDGLHDWIETNRRFVTYSNIEDGDYIFRIKAANHQSNWGETESTVSISIAPPPWRTWWAYVLYGLLVLGIIWAYLRYQARKVEALRQAHRLRTVESELELTGAVQTGFLPTTPTFFNENFGLVGFYRPADRAGGDWWWHENNNDKLTVLIGDVTGHGPGPAMVTAAAATAYRIQSDLGGSLEQRLHVLHREVLRSSGGEYHMTMSAIEIDARTGRFVFYSAGGLPILRLRPGSRGRLLPCPGTPLGSQTFTLGRLDGQIEKGERFLLYTDGIPEIPLPNGRLLGMRRFSRLLENTLNTDMRQAVDHIVQSGDTLRGEAPQDDDWTFAMIEWYGH